MYVPGKQGAIFNASSATQNTVSDSENVVNLGNSEAHIGNISVSVSMSRQESIDCTYRKIVKGYFKNFIILQHQQINFGSTLLIRHINIALLFTKLIQLQPFPKLPQ